MLKQAFYQCCYLNTGWLPMQPLARSVAPCDLCQIRDGMLLPLANWEALHLEIQPVLSEPLALNPLDWSFQQGAKQTYWAREQHNQGEVREQDDWSRQRITFAGPGSFLFHGQEPRCRLITNWHSIEDDITLQVTQGRFGFREVYCVTGVAEVENWALAIAGSQEASLEMTAASTERDPFRLLCHQSSLNEQCQDMAVYERSNEEKAHFFRAKKLVLSDAAYDHYLNELLVNQDKLGSRALANWLNSDLLNLVKSNELNLTTAMDFFSWADLSLDDVARLLARSNRPR